MGANYHSEVTLKCLVECDDFDIQVEGRADGIFDQDECVYIDEIKGILKEVDSLEEPVPVHLAQAKCYACIYAQQNHLEKMSLRTRI